MADTDDDRLPVTDSQDLSEAVGSRELRKVHSRQIKDRTLWLGVGMFGAIGWSIVTPTLFGVLLGMWIDRAWPGHFSWTTAMLLAGVSIGCFSAWHWVSQERQRIDQNSRELKR